MAMNHLLHKRIDAEPFDEDCVFFLAVCEELGKYYDVWIDLTCFSSKILTDWEWCAMTVIKSEAIEIFSHQLDVLFEAIP